MTKSFTGVTTLLFLLTSLVHGQDFPILTGCHVGLTNGGFETGEFAPWVENPFPFQQTTPALSIVSPGYNSANALQLEFPAANETEFFMTQEIGRQCQNKKYFTSFAVNWLDFTPLHGDPETNFCRLDVTPSICQAQGDFNAADVPGWQRHTFVCEAVKNDTAILNVEVFCQATYEIPAFTLQFDDFQTHLVTSK